MHCTVLKGVGAQDHMHQIQAQAGCAANGQFPASTLTVPSVTNCQISWHSTWCIAAANFVKRQLSYSGHW